MSEASNATGSVAESPYRLIYRSHSKIPTDSNQQELADILRKSRTNNAVSGVTGALLMYDGWFAQVLEGPEQKVRQLYDRIKVDPRHDLVVVSEEHAVQSRAFARWAMASVGEHGEADLALVATPAGIADGSPRKTTTPEQETVLTTLRDLTRGYGRGS